MNTTISVPCVNPNRSFASLLGFLLTRFSRFSVLPLVFVHESVALCCLNGINYHLAQGFAWLAHD